MYGKYSMRGMLRDKYSIKQSRVLYLSQNISLSAVFFVHTRTGSAISGTYTVLGKILEDENIGEWTNLNQLANKKLANELISNKLANTMLANELNVFHWEVKYWRMLRQMSKLQ